MHIAYLINRYPAVSHTFIRREILALERLGFEVTRVALRGWDGELVDRDDEAERKRTHYVLRIGQAKLLWAIMSVLLTRPVEFSRALRLALRMSWRAERPLPVHLIYLAEACHIHAQLRKRRIRHVHAHFGTNSAEVAMLINVLGGPSWSFTAHGPEEFDKAALIGLTQKIRKCAFVVAVSAYGRSQLYRLTEYAHWSKIQVVHCGIDRTFFDGPASPVPATGRLVCVGRLCRDKGQLLLVAAAHRLEARGIKFELVLAGDGELRSDIERLIARYRLESKIRITGWIGGDKVRQEILASRALVLPSFAEGLPVVLMEAMALCRPVISTYVGGIPELVHAGEHGWLVPASDIEALVDAMQACLNSPTNVLLNMGMAAHNRVLAQHNVDTEAAKLGKLFQQTIEAGRGA